MADTSETTPTYTHKFLTTDKIRLFLGVRRDEIVCYFSVVSTIQKSWVNEAQLASYEAVSYVWGDPNDTGEIMCNGARL